MGADKTLIIGSCTVDIVIPTPRLPGSADSINSPPLCIRWVRI